MNYPKKYQNHSNYKPQSYQKGQANIVPSFNPQRINTPANIIPTYSKNHNVAGQIKTNIYLKDKYGNEMKVSQVQQVLNLINGQQGTWIVGGNQNYNSKRRK